MNNKKDKYSGFKRPTVPLSEDDHKKIAIFCIQNNLNIGDFLRRAGLYCLEKNIIPSNGEKIPE